MNNIKITTLTPLHVGSGEKPMRDVDFLWFEQEGKVAMLDPEKVLGIIGMEQVDQWVACVSNQEGLVDLLSQRKRNLCAEDVALRVLPVQHRGLGKKSDIHEQIHDGMGRPLLPGSSLKGAIRTALFAHYINQNEGDDAKSQRNLVDRRNAFSDSILSKKYFGDDPNHDVLRLLRIGDATFTETNCSKVESMNLKGDDWIVDSRFTQFTEVIPERAATTFALQFDSTTEKNARVKNYFTNDTSLLQQPKLFEIINRHTRDLAKREAKAWREQTNVPECIDTYLERMDEIVGATLACSPNECILRLGWGTGFRNMTGDWHINMTDDDYFELIRKLRPRHPEDMIYPKSCRLLADGTPLGFVKLSKQQ